MSVAHFPTRKTPHNRPILAPDYYRDPFWGKGPLAFYCSVVCYMADNPVRDAARIQPSV